MANKQEIHLEILCSQINALFTYYSRSKLKKRWVIEEFEPLIVDSRPIVSFLVEVDPKAESKRKVVIKVAVEDRVFSFFNNYSYGVPLSGGVHYTNKLSPEKDLIDIEYALSVATEHLAGQIAKHLE